MKSTLILYYIKYDDIMMPLLIQNLVDWYQWKTLVIKINKEYHESWVLADTDTLIYKHKFDSGWGFCMHWRWELNTLYNGMRIIKINKLFLEYRYLIYNLQKTKRLMVNQDNLDMLSEDSRASGKTHLNFIYCQLYPD